MKLVIKTILGLFLIFGGLLFLSNFLEKKKTNEIIVISEKDKKITNDRIIKKANEIKNFINDKDKYNNEIVFLIDMKISSNKNRFFVYNLNKNEITIQGLVAHGSGSEKNKSNNGELFFSNENNSLCTSLGKYEIKNSYNGDFGKAYKLIGLDKTNSNAFLRNIVLHKYKSVPPNEQKREICLSYGCPMVNEVFFNKLEEIIDNSNKTILLYIYN